MNRAEKFCLKWNDFQPNIEASYKALREGIEFADVTLVCEGNYQIQAHKIILASASNIFKDMLIGNNHSHPLIYMRKVQAEAIVSAVDFIYHGEVTIAQGNLNDFLALAEELQLKGLSGSRETEAPAGNRLEKKIEATRKDSETVSESRTNEYLVSTTRDDKVKEELLSTSFDDTVSILEESTMMEAEPCFTLNGGDNKELDEKINMIVQKVNGVWTCTSCERTAKTSFNIRRHAEIHIEGVSHPCARCEKSFRCRNNLQVHVFRSHLSKSV